MFKRLLATVSLALWATSFAFAQSGTITGVVTDASSGETLPGVNVVIQELQRGSPTNQDGEFTIENVDYGTYTVRASFVGYDTFEQQITVNQQTTTLDIALNSSMQQLDDVVVTAYGQEESMTDLPYSAEKVDGEIVQQSRNSNFIESLQGRVAGLKVSSSSAMGGSTNIIMRGYKSITGNNQVLFVVDGVPYANHEFNTNNVESGGFGYDYGNTGVDINPDNIKSINVLKGPAAAALYGSRASNGAIVIETKKAKNNRDVQITFNSSVGMGFVNPSTFVDYQDKYGQGYIQAFQSQDIDGDGSADRVTRHFDDASFGPRFDSDMMVYQWDAFAPNSPNFQQTTPWTAAENGPMSFFERSTDISNSITINGGFERGHYSMGYSQNTKTGILPNSKLDKHKLNFSAGYDVNDQLTVSGSIQYTRTDGRGRPGTGYNSIMSSFRQWWATNVDIEQQKAAYFRNRNNNTWNWASGQAGEAGIYWNNPYWQRYENFSTDQRDRYFGNVEAKYDVADWLSLTGRVSIDSYNQQIEERINKGSTGIASYTQRNQQFTEFNYDLLANYNHQLTDDIGISGVVGMNIRRNKTLGLTASTNGGLIVPGLYSLNNSASQIRYPNGINRQLGVNGYFASLNLDYGGFLNIEATGRRDKSSSLPEGENVYYYPSVSAGFSFSEFIDANWLSYGKIRASWAEVGNTAPAHSIAETFPRNPNHNTANLYSVPNTKNNPNLKPERTKSWEVGLQMSFFNDRFSYDINYYDQNTINQIIATDVSSASGYSAKFVNAGNVENRGFEVQVSARPVVTQDFAWTVDVNWNKNINTVKALAPGVTNYQLAAPQGGVSISAALGEPYGAIRGTDYVYQDGKRVVNSSGFYKETKSGNNIIGNMNPDWTGGISNRINYKNWSLNFLVDVRWGGDIFSLDQFYGQATGLYPITAQVNQYGNNVREPVYDANGNLLPESERGGIVLSGVKENGEPNDISAPATNYAGAFGYLNNPHAHFIYDASYVKLREVGLTYNLPQELVSKIGPIRGASVSAIGSNLWIIHKNIPHADPEQGIAAGNVRGYQGAVDPSTRNVTFNLKLEF